MSSALVLTAWFYRRLALRIKRSERSFHALLEAAPFAIAVTQRQTGKFLFANRRAFEVLALSPTDYRSQQVPYANAEADRERILQACTRDGRILDMEMALIAFDGRRLPVLGSIAPIEFAGEEALIGTFQDIAALKETELKARTSEARLRAVFEASPDGIIVLDPEGTIQQASESCANLTGNYDLSHAAGRSIFEFLPQADQATARATITRILAEQPIESTYYRIEHQDGTQVWIEPRGIPVLDPTTGQPVIMLVLRDITKRRNAQDQLAAHAAQLQEALNRIAHLQNEIVRVCAWTKQVNVDDEWIPIDHYLTKHLGLKISHGISEAGLAMLEEPPEEPQPPER